MAGLICWEQVDEQFCDDLLALINAEQWQVSDWTHCQSEVGQREDMLLLVNGQSVIATVQDDGTFNVLLGFSKRHLLQQQMIESLCERHGGRLWVPQPAPPTPLWERVGGYCVIAVLVFVGWALYRYGFETVIPYVVATVFAGATVIGWTGFFISLLGKLSGNHK